MGTMGTSVHMLSVRLYNVYVGICGGIEFFNYIKHYNELNMFIVTKKV